MTKRNAGARLLRKFLEGNELTGADLARVLKVHRAQAGRWLSGTFVPRRWAQEAIATWTGGDVPVRAWPVKRTHNKPRPNVVPYRDSSAHSVAVPQSERVSR